MKRFFVFFAFLAISQSVIAQKLPGRHEIKQNEAGEYYVVNSDNITMIEASIIKLGSSARWILACIKHKSIDSDLKRWVFVDIKNKGTFDTLNLENWAFYSTEAYPELQDIKLKSFSEEACP